MIGKLDKELCWQGSDSCQIVQAPFRHVIKYLIQITINEFILQKLIHNMFVTL